MAANLRIQSNRVNRVLVREPRIDRAAGVAGPEGVNVVLAVQRPAADPQKPEPVSNAADAGGGAAAGAAVPNIPVKALDRVADAANGDGPGGAGGGRTPGVQRPDGDCTGCKGSQLPWWAWVLLGYALGSGGGSAKPTA